MKNNKSHATVNSLIETLYSQLCPILGSRCLYIFSSRIDEFKNNKGQIILMNEFKSTDGFIVKLDITGKNKINKIHTDTLYNGVMTTINYLHNIELSPLIAKRLISNILFTETEFFQKYFVTVAPATLQKILDNTIKECRSGNYYK